MCAIYGGQSDTRTGFSPNSSVFSFQHYSTVVHHTHISSGSLAIGPLVAAISSHPNGMVSSNPTMTDLSTQIYFYPNIRNSKNKYCVMSKKKHLLFRSSLRFSVSKDHPTAQSISLFLSLYRVYPHIVYNRHLSVVILDHTVATTNMDTTIASVIPVTPSEVIIRDEA
jgi:hypothetical protein